MRGSFMKQILIKIRAWRLRRAFNIKRIGYFMVLSAFVTLSNASVAYAAYGSVSSSTTTPYYVTQWGSHGTGNGQFTSPRGAAIGSNGIVYVLDTGNKRVEEFTSDGTYVTQWGSSGSGNGQFLEPLAIAANTTTGNIYVADGFNCNIQEFTSNGTYVMQWGSCGFGNGQFSFPTGIAVSGNNNLYVSDWDNSNVQEFTSNGIYVTQWGSSGTGDGQFQDPAGIATDLSGNVYVADTNNFNVQKFTSDGTFITKWGSHGAGNGQFNDPLGVNVSNNGLVYVSDVTNNNIQVFTTDGTYVTQWGSSGSGNGQFNSPYGGAITTNGTGYIVDTYNNRIQEFAAPNNLGAVVSANGTNNIRITLPSADNISALQSVASAGNDSKYSYPLGLVNFTFSTTAGATVPVTLTVQTSLTPSQVVARKYNPNTQQYATIPGAVVTAATLNGQPALQIAYNITDGGPLDEDSTANGVIVDPVGLAVASTAAVSSPNTGYGQPGRQNLVVLAAIIGATLSLALGAYLARQA